MNRLIMIGTFLAILAIIVLAIVAVQARRKGNHRPAMVLTVFAFVCACLAIVFEVMDFVHQPRYGLGLLIVGNALLLPALWQKLSSKPAAPPAEKV